MERYNDTKSPEEIIRAFYQISGMEISLTDPAYKNASVICRSQSENFCSLIHRSTPCLEKCKESDALRLNEAQELEDVVVYTCPFGIREVILPIKRDESIDGIIFCSMGKDATTKEEEIIEKVKALAPTIPEEEISYALAEMKKIDKPSEEAHLKLLLLIKAHIERSPQANSETSLGERIKSYIRNNPARKISLADLSWNFHCSTVTLTQHFKKEFGITINEYITKTRMKLARGLLTEKKEPLHKIALLCGYPDVEYFSRTFKKYHGIPPGQWREENKATDE